MRRYKINKEFIYKIQGTEISIFDPEKSNHYTLNETASYILNELKRGGNEDEIVRKIICKYNVELQTAVRDTSEALDTFREYNIILS